MEAFFRNDEEVREWVDLFIEKLFTVNILSGNDADSEFTQGRQAVEKIVLLFQEMFDMPKDVLVDGIRQLVEQRLPDPRVIENFPDFYLLMNDMINAGLKNIEIEEQTIIPLQVHGVKNVQLKEGYLKSPSSKVILTGGPISDLDSSFSLRSHLLKTLELPQNYDKKENKVDNDKVIKEESSVVSKIVSDDAFKGINDEADQAYKFVSNELAGELAEEPIEELAGELAEEPIEELTEEVAEEPIEELTEEVAEEPIEELTEELIEELTEELIEEVSREVNEVDKEESISNEISGEVGKAIVDEVNPEVFKNPAPFTRSLHELIDESMKQLLRESQTTIDEYTSALIQSPVDVSSTEPDSLPAMAKVTCAFPPPRDPFRLNSQKKKCILTEESCKTIAPPQSIASPQQVPPDGKWLAQTLRLFYPDENIQWNYTIEGQCFFARIDKLLIYILPEESTEEVKRRIKEMILKMQEKGLHIYTCYKEDLAYPRRLERGIRRSKH